MLLAYAFPDPLMNLTLEVFLRELRGLLGPRLLSVMLYGSLVCDDLAPGYGDVDFVVVVDRELGDEERVALAELRIPLRSGNYGHLATMLEGAFMPRDMLYPNAAGSGFWWGTTRERAMDHNHLGWLNSLDIRENGLIIFGADLRTEIPAPRQEDLLREIRYSCHMMRQGGNESGPHLVDGVLQSARFLAFVKERRLFSKSEAAKWAEKQATGRWRLFLSDCSQYRRDPVYRARPGIERWLDELRGPLKDACSEVELALDQIDGI